jgi:hypothetical protein
VLCGEWADLVWEGRGLCVLWRVAQPRVPPWGTGTPLYPIQPEAGLYRSTGAPRPAGPTYRRSKRPPHPIPEAKC